MDNFAGVERVRFISPGALHGYTGTVVRRLISSSHEAWVRMDKDLPEGMVSFEDERRRDILLDAGDCEPVVTFTRRPAVKKPAKKKPKRW